MIETIFYFPESKDQYENNKGNISARTISFVPTGDGETGDIYKNGIKYGSSIDRDEILSIINDAIEDADFDIPFASTTKAGIIKLGKGLKSVGSDGTVDVDFTGLNGIDGLDGLIENILKTIIDKNGTGVVVTPRLSSGTAIADIKVGSATKTIYAPAGSGSGSGTNEGKDYSITNFSNSGTTLTISQNNNSAKSVDIKNAITSSVSVSRILDSGTPIADITVGNSTTRLFAPAGSGSGGGQGSGSEPYDDTDIKNAIKDLQDRADATESDLRDLLDETEEEVREKFKNAFDTYEDLINYYKQSGDTTPTKFTFGKEDADEWASQMGLITPNDDGTYNVGWSTLTQSYDRLAGEVAQIKANQSVGGEIDYEALSAGLYAYIDENAATSGMDSTWGKFVKKDDDEIQMLEWMESAIKTYASNEEAYSRLLAAAKDYDENGSTIQEGIAKIDAFVEKDSNGNYVAGTSLASMIDNGVNTSLSEVFTENSSNAAISGLYSRLSDAESRADDAYNYASENYDAISGLQNTVENINGEYIAKSDLVSAITNKKDEILSSAGFASSAQLSNATSSMTSQIDGVRSSIETCVKKDSNGVIESGVTINADKINIGAGHELNLTSQHVNLDADRINMSGLITAINKDGGSVTIDADKINVGGILIEDLNVSGINDLIANSATIKNIQADLANVGTLTAEQLTASNGNATLSINATDGISFEGGESDNAIRMDGSGSLADGKIYWNSNGSGAVADGAIAWDTSGNITLGSKFINAVNADLSVNSLEAGSSNKIYVDSSNGVYVDGTCDSKINPDGSGYLGNNAITWGTDGSGSIANGAITWSKDGSVSSMNLNGDGYTYIGVNDVSIGDKTELFAGQLKLETNLGDRPSYADLNGMRLSIDSYEGSCEYSGTGPSKSSDMRKKDVIENENISIENIAEAPLFKYRMKGYPDGPVQIGSSAQYWQDLVPEAVSSDEEGYLRMNYITLNTVVSLTSAKEIVKLKEENTTLKQRVEALEARLQLIENKLNA